MKPGHNVLVVFAVLFLTFLSTSTSVAEVIQVPADRATIQAGISAAADGDTVLVADGTYTGSGNRLIDLQGKAVTVRSANGSSYTTIDLQDTGPAFLLSNGEEWDTVITGFRIINGFSNLPGGAIRCLGAGPTIVANSFTNNRTSEYGGAIFCSDLFSARIHRCFFAANEADLEGGAISVRGGAYSSIHHNRFVNNLSYTGGAVCVADGSGAATYNNRFENNSASWAGGALYCTDSGSRFSMMDSLITGNEAGYMGGVGITVEAEGRIQNCLIIDNVAQVTAGGINVGADATLQLRYTNITGNSAVYGGGVVLVNASITMDSCIVWGNTADSGAQLRELGGTFDVTYSCIQGGWSGTGNISANPLFTDGPLGSHYLSQQSAGQAQDSPCVDTAHPDWGLEPMTTRTDGGWDEERTDMGYHRAPARIVTGAGPGYDNPPAVRIFPPENDAESSAHFSAYGAPHYGVNVCTGRVYSSAETEDTDQIITGAGPGAIYGPHVRGFFIDGTQVPGLSFLAYGTNKYGVNVAAAHTQSGIGTAIVTGAGPGRVFGPHVRAFLFDQDTRTVSPLPGVSFFAYGTNKWGVNVAAGDIDGDRLDEIVTGPGPGTVFGPHVRGWNVDGGSAQAIPGVSFLAYGTNKYGVNVTCGDVDGDDIAEIVTAPGPGAVFGAHIRGWDYDGIELRPLPYFDFFAWTPGEARYGATVYAGTDLDHNGRDELIVGCGPDPDVGTPVKVYTYWNREGIVQMYTFEAFPVGHTHGTRVAGGLL